MFAQPEVCFPCLELIPSNGTFCSADAGPAAGPGALPPVDPLAPQDVQAGGEVHPEDNSDAEQDEGDRPALQVPSSQCTGHGR